VADATRYGAVETDGDRLVAFRERPADGAGPLPGTINAGVYVFDRRVLDEVTETCSLERDVMPRLAERGALRATAGAGYFVDIGIPADLDRARTELPAHLHRPALFLDRDGVVNVDHGYVGTRERFEWTASAIAAIAAATDRGWHVFIVTNQSGVARGHYDEAAVALLHEWLAEEVRRAGGTVDDVRYCPFHPEAPLDAYRRESDWRKPAPGMILDLLRVWDVDPARCLLVGDQPTDIAAAEAAGVAGHLFADDDLAGFVAARIRARAAAVLA
jgi:D-glycero-D-manno-heptose 1,7-bisphosphate phosphatase